MTFSLFALGPLLPLDATDAERINRFNARRSGRYTHEHFYVQDTRRDGDHAACRHCGYSQPRIMLARCSSNLRRAVVGELYEAAS